jgi:hypothetical protein
MSSAILSGKSDLHGSYTKVLQVPGQLMSSVLYALLQMKPSCSEDGVGRRHNLFQKDFDLLGHLKLEFLSWQ